MQTSFLLKLSLFAACCLFVGTMYAQRNYRPGFIITLLQDTLYGQLDYRTDDINAERCVFVDRNETEPQTYYPTDLFGYRFTDDGKYYVSKTIQLSKNETPRTVFLEYLLQGMKSLYFYEDNAGLQVYFIEEDKGLIKMDAPVAEGNDKGVRLTGTIRRYIPVLKYAFADCPELNEEIENAKFNHKSLIEITKDYHYRMCTNNEECIEFEAKEDKKRIQVSFMLYGGICQYWFTEKVYPGSSSYNSYMIGARLSFGNRRRMKSLRYWLDLSLSRAKADILEPDYTYNRLYKSELTSNVFSTRFGVRYTCPVGGRVQPFVEGGLGFDAAYKETYIGYGVNVGIQIKYSKKINDYLLLPGGYKGAFSPEVLIHQGWSVVLGYVF